MNPLNVLEVLDALERIDKLKVTEDIKNQLRAELVGKRQVPPPKQRKARGAVREAVIAFFINRDNAWATTRELVDVMQSKSNAAYSYITHMEDRGFLEKRVDSIKPSAKTFWRSTINYYRLKDFPIHE